MHPIQKRLLKSITGMGLAVLSFLAPAHAENASENKPLRLTVRPSDYEGERNEALERQQKLLKRLERSNHMMRSICINCDDSWKHQIYAPFNPLSSLSPSGRTTDTTVE